METENIEFLFTVFEGLYKKGKKDATLLKMKKSSYDNVLYHFLNGINSVALADGERISKEDQSEVNKPAVLDKIDVKDDLEMKQQGKGRKPIVILKNMFSDMQGKVVSIQDYLKSSSQADGGKEEIDLVQSAEEHESIRDSIEKEFNHEEIESSAEEKNEEVVEAHAEEASPVAEDQIEEVVDDQAEEIDYQKMIKDAPAKIDFFDSEGNPKKEESVASENVKKEGRVIPIVVPERTAKSVNVDLVKESENRQQEENILPPMEQFSAPVSSSLSIESDSIDHEGESVEDITQMIDSISALLVENHELKQQVEAEQAKIEERRYEVTLAEDVFKRSKKTLAEAKKELNEIRKALQEGKEKWSALQKESIAALSVLEEQRDGYNEAAGSIYDQFGMANAFVNSYVNSLEARSHLAEDESDFKHRRAA